MAVQLADVFRLHGREYLESSGSVLPGHAKALRDITRCRTPALGGQAFHCPDCRETRYSYHSCNNRHCPKCQNDETTAWVQKQEELLLPVSYFFATFTVPEELNRAAYAHQKAFYNAFFRASSRALLECSRNPRFLGADVGFMGVLQTWTRDLRYHPHIHYVIPGGGLPLDGGGDSKAGWIPAKDRDFLVHVKPLSRLFKGKLRDELRRSGFFQEIPSSVWSKDWVVHIQPAGTGRQVIAYLAPYVFRAAISNNRIVGLSDGKVTFKFKDAGSKRWAYQTLDAVAFIRRFMKHVLPRGLAKVRYYGFLAPNRRKALRAVRALLEGGSSTEMKGKPIETPAEKNGAKEIATENDGNAPEGKGGGARFPALPRKPMTCAHCGGPLIWVRDLPRAWNPP